MSDRPPLADARLIVARTILQLLRLGHDTYRPGHKFATDLDAVLLIVAIFMGQAEGRPFSASKLAAFLDLPRSTVLRRLKSLEQDGTIERAGPAYRMPAALAGSPKALRAALRAIDIVARAGADLGQIGHSVRLDTKTV